MPGITIGNPLMNIVSDSDDIEKEERWAAYEDVLERLKRFLSGVQHLPHIFANDSHLFVEVAQCQRLSLFHETTIHSFFRWQI